MAELGNVLQPAVTGPKGITLEYTVKIPPSALGAGVVVKIPLNIKKDGKNYIRSRSPHDRGDQVTLHLPQDLPKKAKIALRGQGAILEGGATGDLILTIVLTDQTDETWVGKLEQPKTDQDTKLWLFIGGGIILLLIALIAASL